MLNLRTPFLRKHISGPLRKKLGNLALTTHINLGMNPLVNNNSLSVECFSSDINTLLIYFGLSHSGLLDLLKENCECNTLFIDVGANVGIWTLLVSQVSETIDVHSFEPSPVIFKRLSNNVNYNGMPNIKLHQSGLSDQAGECFFDDRSGDVNIGNLE